MILKCIEEVDPLQGGFTVGMSYKLYKTSDSVFPYEVHDDKGKIHKVFCLCLTGSEEHSEEEYAKKFIEWMKEICKFEIVR